MERSARSKTTVVGAGRGRETPGPRAARMVRMLWVLPVLVAGVVHVGLLRNGFAYDDVVLMDALGHHQVTVFGGFGAGVAPGAGGTVPVFRDQRTRPVTYALDVLDNRLWAGSPFGFHLTNLLLHMLATALAYFAARLWTMSRAPAIVAALLFAVHPLHVEAVASVANRKDVLALIFGLGALLAWVRIARPLPRRLVTSVLLLLGLGAKEVAVIGLPVVLLAADGLLGDAPAGARPRPWQTWMLRGLAGALGLLIVVGLVWGDHLPLFNRAHVLEATEYQLQDARAVLANAVLGILRLVRLLVLPAGLSADYPLATGAALAGPGVWLGGAALAALILLPLALYARRPRVALALGWVGLTYLPISNLVPLIHIFAADRYAYVPSFGYCVLLGLGFEALGRRTAARGAAWRAAQVATALVVGLLATGTMRRVPDWADDLALWSSASRAGLETYRIHHKLGVALLKAGDANAEAAARELTRAMALRPGRTEDHEWLAGALFAGGHLDDAAREAELALRAEPASAICRFIRAEALLEHGQTERALADYRAAAAADTTHVGAMIRIAMIDLAGAGQRPGDLAEAIAMARRAARCTEEGNPEAHRQAVELLGQADSALRSYPGR